MKRFLLALCLSVAATPVQAAPHARADAHGDSLPDGALARLGTLRFRIPLGVKVAALAPDGKTVAAANSEEPWVYLLDAATGQDLRGLALEPRESVRALTFSADGSTLAVAAGDHLTLFDPATGKQLRQWLTQRGADEVVFSGDGKTLAGVFGSKGGEGSEVRVWDAATGKQIGRREPYHNEDTHVALSPDGSLLASWGRHVTSRPGKGEGKSDGSGKGKGQEDSEPEEVRVWEIAARKEVGLPVERLLGDRARAAFSPDGKTLAFAAGGSTLYLWDVTTGKEVRRQAMADGGSVVLAFAPDGKTLASANEAGVAELWEAATGRRLGRCQGPAHPVHALAVGTAGTAVALGSFGEELCLWEVPSGKRVNAPEGHPGRVRLAAFTPDGKTLVTASPDGSCCLWDPAAGKERSRFLLRGDRDSRFAPDRYNGFDLSPDGKLLAALEGETLRLWDLGTVPARPVYDLEQAAANWWVVCFSPDGRFLATGRDATLGVWEAGTGKQVYRAKEPAHHVRGLAFSPDGRVVFVGLAADLDVPHPPGVRAVEVATGKEVWRVPRDQGPEGLAASPDGRLLAVAERRVALWDAATGRELRPLEDPGGPAWFTAHLVFSPDGRLVAAATPRNGGGDRVLVWEVASGSVRHEFTGHQGGVNGLGFSPDGRVLASGAGDTTVLLWDLAGALAEHPKAAPTDKELEGLWEDLAARDGRAGYQAVVRLAASPKECVTLLRQRVRPVQPQPPGERELGRLIADLDSDDFATREQATRRLEEAGPAARAALTRALEGRPSAEAKKRLESVLRRLDAPDEWLGLLRPLRAVEALERADTPEARRLLEELAAGRSDALLTREAKAALARLAGQAAPKP
jgi:WD40 repeat protein